MIPEFYNIVADCVDRQAADPQVATRLAARFFFNDEEGVLTEGQALDFGRAAALVNRTAFTLTALGGAPGDRIVLCLPNGPDFMILFLGAIKAGLIPVPASNQLTHRELEFILADSGARFAAFETFPAEIQWHLIHCKPLLMRTDQFNGGDLDFLKVFLAQTGQAFPLHPTPREDAAYWLYTSGTTGIPKAVIHAHQSIPAHEARVALWQNAKAGDVVFNTSALNWSYALTCGFLDLWRHGIETIILKGKPTAAIISQVVKEAGVTVFMGVPGIYRRLADFLEKTKENPFANVHSCLSAGEKLPEAIRNKFKKYTGLEIREGLGMSEHSVYLVQAAGEPVVPGSCGRPLAGTRTAVLRDDLTMAPADEVGWLASHRENPGLMKGYYNRSYEEGLCFRGDWFLSGDLARIDSAGNYFYEGRADDIIKAGGYKISPLEVEAVLNSHPDVAECGVAAWNPEPGKTFVVACVVAKPGVVQNEETGTRLIHYSGETLAAYKVPRKIKFCEKLPRTVTGKIKRSELLKSW